MIGSAFIAVERINLPITVAGPLWELRTGATDYICLLSFQFTFAAAANSTIEVALGTPAARGISPASNEILPLAGDTSVSIGGLSVAKAWATAPTVPTRFLRRMTQAGNTASASLPFQFVFSGGLKMAPNSSLVCWILTAGGTGFQISGSYIDTNLEISQ